MFLFMKIFIILGFVSAAAVLAVMFYIIVKRGLRESGEERIMTLCLAVLPFLGCCIVGAAASFFSLTYQ
jgi:hypothetical protein